MRFLIVSDSHGLTEELTTIFERHEAEIDDAFHCGDSQLALVNEHLLPYRTVRGNCDFGGDLPLERIETTDAGTILIVHGHHHDVKFDLNRLRYRAEEVGANVVLFGHSHVAGALIEDGVVYINPGSIRMPRGRTDKTYALLDLEKGEAAVRFYRSEDGSHVEDLDIAGKL
ncbi:metallophosphoesterase family protein [Exiguobacterium sp. MMG028]|uniref:metallophosphoesterase family protein n=1 Tax=Exiguobacterium sp. MMG028 TaxID=3021979 RepID=UPI0022FE6DBE|nr:metallophosphoesterase family protein [Exiguobacterium sp. MMG028]MDA5560322.1 metallophosphoesterase family protein [Exiguobacterium sp. MMG028]